jgi:hypothetical protein
MTSSITRRALFSLAGATGVGLAVAACSKSPSGGSSSGSQASSGSAGGSSTTATAKVSALSPAQVPLAGGSTVTVKGSGLGSVTGVLVAGVAATNVVAKSDRVTFTVPHQVGYTAGKANVQLTAGAVTAGEAPDPQPTAAAPSDTPSSGTITLETPAATASDSPTAAGRTTTVATTSVEYAALTDVDRQLEYAMKWWHVYNVAEYGNMNAIGGDCANFTSQTLIARGWKQRSDWYNTDGGSSHSSTWTYCPSFDPWLTTNGAALGLTRRSLSERDKVKVGDIVFYDWNNNGSPDHVTVVSQVTKDSTGKTVIKSVSHNDDGQYRDLDYMISVQHPGGTAWFHTFDA